MTVSPARAAAFEILMRIETTDAYASEMLHSSQFAKLSQADHGLLTELVMGVLRWRGTLDERIKEHSKPPLGKLDVEVLTALRMGAYQILFLDRVPGHAAINESVELVKGARKRSAAGMVNAVLRKISRDGDAVPYNGVPHPQKPGEMGHPAQPDIELDRRSSNYRSSDYRSSHPQWIVERWEEIYGQDGARKICAYDQAAPATTIRVNDTAVLEELRAEGIRLESAKLLPKAFTVESGEITRTAAFRERRLAVQDEASQLVALLVGRGKRVLDCCAAPGGKTRIISERNPESEIVAMELHPRRAALLKRLVSSDNADERAQTGNVRVIAADVRQMPLAKAFDRVLVDAPCSGTGTLARNPEIKWRLGAEDIPRMAEYQIEILRAAMKQVSSGGRLIYSTCSLEPEENSGVIEKALAENPSFRLLDCRDALQELRADGELAWDDMDSLVSGTYLRTIPGVHPCDGFFAAIIQRR